MVNHLLALKIPHHHNTISEDPYRKWKRGIGFICGSFNVFKFLNVHKINFIIRGHQDNCDNNYLFSNVYKITKNNRLLSDISELPRFGLDYSLVTRPKIYGHKYSNQL